MLRTFICFGLLFCCVLASQKYFVSPENGASSNPGTFALPFRTIRDGLNAYSAASDGDQETLVLFLDPDTYEGSDNVGLTFNMPTRMVLNKDTATFVCDSTRTTGIISNSNLALNGLHFAQFRFNSCQTCVNVTSSMDTPTFSRDDDDILSKSSMEIFEHDVNVELSGIEIRSIDSNVNGVSIRDARYVTVRHSRFENPGVSLECTVSGVAVTSSSAVTIGSSWFDGSGPFVATNYEYVSLYFVHMRNMIMTGTHSAVTTNANEFTLAFFNAYNVSSVANGGVVQANGRGELRIEASRFEECKSGGDGGAMYIDGLSGPMQNVRFENCSALGDGGAIYFGIGFEIALVHARFDSCSAAYGGAVKMISFQAEIYMENVVFTNNFASEIGSCLSCCPDDGVCHTVSIEDNGIYFTENGSPTIDRCLLKAWY